MASVKAKFRPSVIEGKEGTVYYQIIQNPVIRQLKTDYTEIKITRRHIEIYISMTGLTDLYYSQIVHILKK